MANMISNSSNNNNSNSSASTSSYTFNNNYNSETSSSSRDRDQVVEVQTLRDVCNMLNLNAVLPATDYRIPLGGCAYDHIIALMRELNLQDDGILLNSKIKTIETDFCNIVRDESMLCESMEYMNDKALSDGDIALKFALLFSSRNFDALAMKETKVRSAMLKILETNFINADAYRVHDKNRLYNSITLLGEYYHRVRLADNAPITILGDSLLSLLTREVNDTSVVIGTRLARLVLSQITLNGEIMRTRHKAEIDLLLFHVRRHLIMQPALTPKVKAMLLMVLDLFYSHFKHIGHELEAMYTDYLVVDEGEDDGLNNNAGEIAVQEQAEAENGSSSAHNSSQDHDSFEAQPTTKKWSEQVCEDSFCDIGYGEAEGLETQQPQQQQQQNHVPAKHQSHRGYQPRHAPRPLKPQQPQQAEYVNQ